jgi:hypothetical protein
MPHVKRARKTYRKRPWRRVFLRELARADRNATVINAARVAGISRRAAYKARATDKAFARSWERALERAEGRMLAEAQKQLEEWQEREQERRLKVHKKDGQFGHVHTRATSVA